MKKTALILMFAALPAAAQSYSDGTAFGGSSIFSSGANPRANPARYDLLPAGIYLGGEIGDFKPRGEHDAADQLETAEASGDPTQLGAALAAVNDHPWAERDRKFGLAYAAPGGLRLGYTHEDLRGAFTAVDLPSLDATQDARQAVVDRVYAGAGSQEGNTALGFVVRLDRVRLGQQTSFLNAGPGQPALGNPEASLEGGFTPTDGVTSATVDLGYLQNLSPSFRFGITLDRIASRRFGDLKEDPQARAGLQLDLTPSMKLSVESDINAAERLPFAVKQRVAAASLRIDASSTTFFTLGAERCELEDTPKSLVFGVAAHFVMAPLVLSLGFRFGDDRQPGALALRLPGAN